MEVKSEPREPGSVSQRPWPPLGGPQQRRPRPLAKSAKPMTTLTMGWGLLGQRVAPLGPARGGRVLATPRRPTPSALAEPIVCDVLDPSSLARLPAADTV